MDICALCSPCGHCRRLAFALPRWVAHASTFLSPFPRRGFAFPTSRGSHRFGTMETLTPVPLTYGAGLPAYLATPSCRSASNHVGCLVIASPPRQRDQRFSGFAMESQARRSSPPNRVCHPTDRQFASGCSPRRFGPTQFQPKADQPLAEPSATELWHTPTRTFTVLMRRPHGRTIPACAGMTDKVLSGQTKFAFREKDRTQVREDLLKTRKLQQHKGHKKVFFVFYGFSVFNC